MDFTKIATEFGVSVALLMVFLYSTYRAGSWIALNVVKPLADRHLIFIEKIEKVQVEQALTLHEIATSKQKQAELEQQVILQLKVLHQVAQKTLDTMMENRESAVRILQADHQEILRRLPEQKG